MSPYIQGSSAVSQLNQTAFEINKITNPAPLKTSPVPAKRPAAPITTLFKNSPTMQVSANQLVRITGQAICSTTTTSVMMVQASHSLATIVPSTATTFANRSAFRIIPLPATPPATIASTITTLASQSAVRMATVPATLAATTAATTYASQSPVRMATLPVTAGRTTHASQSPVRMATQSETPAETTSQAGFLIPTLPGIRGVSICVPNQKRDVIQPTVVINLPFAAASLVQSSSNITTFPLRLLHLQLGLGM